MKLVISIAVFLLSVAAAAVNPGEVSVGRVSLHHCSTISYQGRALKARELCTATVSGDLAHQYLVLLQASPNRQQEIFQIRPEYKMGREIRFTMSRFSLESLMPASQKIGMGTMRVSATQTPIVIDLRMLEDNTLIGSLPLVTASQFRQ